MCLSLLHAWVEKPPRLQIERLDAGEHEDAAACLWYLVVHSACFSPEPARSDVHVMLKRRSEHLESSLPGHRFPLIYMADHMADLYG